MVLFSSLFSSSLTPIQYCFPYFFDERLFGKQIEKLGLRYSLSLDEKSRLFNPLSIFDNSDFHVQINYFTYVMFDSSGNMIIWTNGEDIIYISKIFTKNGNITKTDFNVNLKNLKTGENLLEADSGLANFVTYGRKTDIIYDLDYFENFAVVIVNKNYVNVIPFDWFNKSGGDYGYVWPATARLNLKTKELFGKGMRMADFRVQL